MISLQIHVCSVQLILKFFSKPAVAYAALLDLALLQHLPKAINAKKMNRHTTIYHFN